MATSISGIHVLHGGAHLPGQQLGFLLLHHGQLLGLIYLQLEVLLDCSQLHGDSLEVLLLPEDYLVCLLVPGEHGGQLHSQLQRQQLQH